MTNARQALPPVRAVLFDWDNTLVDSWQTIHEALNLTLARFSMQAWSLAETKERVRLSTRDAFPLLFGDRWEVARESYLAAFEAIHLQRLAALPGAEACLEAIGASGTPMAVVSNKTGRLLRTEVTALGWDRHFGSLVGAGDAARDKPDPAPLFRALDDLRVAHPAEAWYVGDTDVDIACARNAGAVAVLLHADDAAGEVPEAAVADLAFEGFGSFSEAFWSHRACIAEAR